MPRPPNPGRHIPSVTGIKGREIDVHHLAPSQSQKLGGEHVAACNFRRVFPHVRSSAAPGNFGALGGHQGRPAEVQRTLNAMARGTLQQRRLGIQGLESLLAASGRWYAWA